MTILVTGGSGYIGSHTCIELIKENYDIVVVDNLSNSSIESIRRIEKIVNIKIPFHKIDIRDKVKLSNIFKKYYIDAVIHFAGLKSVSESVEMPLVYYRNNLDSTIALCEVMKDFRCKNFVFSSSANVYGKVDSSPVNENFPLNPSNPYGKSKLMIETILKDLFESDPSWNISILRYFNPTGSHESGLIGEDPSGIPNNLIPNISQVAIGKQEKLKIYGGDYNTIDGTGVRDYIHVVDLAKGHINALKAIQRNEKNLIVNLGTGQGYSVLQIIKAFEVISGKIIPYEIVSRRNGDIAECFADTSHANEILKWSAQYSLEEMCSDTWRWQSMNPHGFNT